MIIATLVCPLIPVAFYPLAAMGAFIPRAHIWINEMRWSVVIWTVSISYIWFIVFAIPMHIILNRRRMRSAGDYIQAGAVIGFISPVIIVMLINLFFLFHNHPLLFSHLTYFSFVVELIILGMIVSIFTVPPVALFWFLVQFKK